MKIIIYFASISIICLTTYFLALNLVTKPLPSSVIKIEEVSVLRANNIANLHLENEKPKSQKLKYRWDGRKEKYASLISQFKLNSQPEVLHAIYLPFFTQNIKVLINDIEVGNTGVFDPKMPLHWRTPFYFQIPASLLNQGKNKLEIIAASVLSGEVGNVYLATDEILKPYYQRHYHMAFTYLVIVAILLAVLFLITLFSWLFNRTELSFLWLSICSLIGSIHVGIMLASSSLFENKISMSVFLTIATVWFAVFGMFYIRSFVSNSNYSFRKPIVYIGITVSALLSTLDVHSGNFLLIILTIYACLINYINVNNYYQIGKYYFDNFRNSGNELTSCKTGNQLIEASLLLMSLSGILFFSFYDTLYLLRIIDGAGYQTPYLTPFFIVIFFSVQLKRLILDNKLNKKEMETKVKFAIEGERERIKQDLHDGVASQLVSLLSINNRKNNRDTVLNEHLQCALDDLRLIVDAEQDIETNINMLLASFRQRIEPILKENCIDLVWSTDYVDNFHVCFNQIELLRILQESIANIIKHSQADQVTISSRMIAKSISVTIEDNGVGIPMEVKHEVNTTSHGLINMRKRAKKIGGEISIENVKTGTLISLTINATA